jgi:hypothetical protein
VGFYSTGGGDCQWFGGLNDESMVRRVIPARPSACFINVAGTKIVIVGVHGVLSALTVARDNGQP